MITQAIQLHFNSDMHRSAIEKEHLKQISPFQKEHESRKQCENEVLNKVSMSIYWLAKEEISNTQLLSLLNLMERAGLQNLKHFTYTGEGTLQEMFLILGQVVKDRVTERVNKSKFFGCLVDEVTDVSVLQQFVTFVKYVHEGKSRTEFLHTEHLSEATGKALAESLEGILEKCSLDISKMKSCVSDGANAMLGAHNGMVAHIRKKVPDLVNIHCVCHRLALACVDTCKELTYLMTEERLLNQVWKFYDYSPKKTAKLVMVQMELLKLLPTEQMAQAKKRVKKAKKAAATRWLSHKASVESMKQEFVAHITVFDFFKESDATACGLLTQTRNHKFIGAIYIMDAVLPPLAILSKAFQFGELSFDAIPSVISACIAKLDKVVSEKDEILAQLSQDMEENGKFGMIELSPNDATTQFLSRLCVSYVENLKKNIRRFPNIPLIAAFSIFNPEAIPERNSPEFKRYGEEKLAKLADHFSSTLDTERLKSEWDHFKFMALEIKQEYSTVSTMLKTTPTELLLSKLTSSKSYSFMFPNLVSLAELAQSIPLTNAWPERGGNAICHKQSRVFVM